MIWQLNQARLKIMEKCKFIILDKENHFSKQNIGKVSKPALGNLKKNQF